MPYCRDYGRKIADNENLCNEYKFGTVTIEKQSIKKSLLVVNKYIFILSL